jgi:hypothetical protein
MTSIELNSVTLPSGTAIKRQLRRPVPDDIKVLFEAGQLGSYDSYTLLYDIFLNTDNKTITAIGPPLLNLEQQLLPAHIKINGHKLPLIVRTHHKKLIILEATSPAQLFYDTPAVIYLANGQLQSITLTISTPLDGLSLVTVQKNNKIRWIRDWISYYHNEFGVENIFIYDNNSDKQEALIETLSNIATVIPWNFPHGIRHRSGNKYCQVGALNHFKYKFGKNTVILNFDIDELLVCNNSKIRRNILHKKTICFNSYNVPFDETICPDYSFKDFIYRDKLPRNGSLKYAMKGSLPGIMNVHHYNPAPRFWHKLLPRFLRHTHPVPQADAYFLHYLGITTNWKIHDRDRLKIAVTNHELTEDTAVIDAFSRFQL